MQLSKLKKKAFTLIELLVVIILIGIVSVIAIPNVKVFLIEKETRNDVLAMTSVADSLKADLNSNLSRNPNNIAGDTMDRYAMGILVFEQYPDQFRMVKRYRTVELFKSTKNCDPGGSWDSNHFYYDYSLYPNFKNIVMSGPTQQASGQLSFCSAKEPTLIAPSSLTIHVCNSYNNPSRTCSISNKNDPIYKISFDRVGVTSIQKYNYNNSTWNVIQN